MGQPVVHFEIIGNDPAKLRRYYGDLFGWEFDTSGPVAEAVSQAGNYGFVDHHAVNDGVGIPGGVGGGTGYDGHVIFYVGVPDVEAALEKAESLGGTRQMGPVQAPGDKPRGRPVHGSRGPLDRPRQRNLTAIAGLGVPPEDRQGFIGWQVRASRAVSKGGRYLRTDRLNALARIFQ